MKRINEEWVDIVRLAQNLYMKQEVKIIINGELYEIYLCNKNLTKFKGELSKPGNTGGGTPSVIIIKIFSDD